MAGNDEVPEWKRYERVVAALHAEGAGLDVSVTPNAMILGRLSGVLRQVDVLLDARWGDDVTATRVIVDAKRHASKIDVKDVEEFEGMMRDCAASRGVLVCPQGFTPAALRRSQDAITITILTLEEFEEMEGEIHLECCMGHCAAFAKRGIFIWEYRFAGDGGAWLLYATGKCDTCHNFQVWCWDCGDRFAMADEDEHVCGCEERRWVTVIEAEPGDSGKIGSAVHLLLQLSDQVLAIDRRRLR